MTRTIESGSVTAFVVGIVLTIFTCGALVVDGGRIVREYLRFADLAENAARSGSQELRSLRSGDPSVDPARATQAARQYLSRYGVSGDVRVADGEVIVSITAQVEFGLLKIIGLDQTEVTATRIAMPVST
jgi:Flp pilus assembly protein TadG